MASEIIPYDRERFLKVGMSMGSFEELMRAFVKTQNAKRVLDVRMRGDHQTLSFAEHLPRDGKLVVLDIDPTVHMLKLKYFAASPHGSKVDVRLGRTVQSIHEMMARGEQFDLILFDAANYETMTECKIAFDAGLLAKHGTVIVENAYEGGIDYRPSAHATATHLLGEYIPNEPGLHKVLLPMAGGVVVLRRLRDVQERCASMRVEECDWLSQLYRASYDY